MIIKLIWKRHFFLKSLTKELWLKKWFFKIFQFQADSRKTSISANPYYYFIFFKLHSNLYIIMTIPTNFHPVWTFQWAAMKENIFEKSCFTPLLIGLRTIFLSFSNWTSISLSMSFFLGSLLQFCFFLKILPIFLVHIDLLQISLEFYLC